MGNPNPKPASISPDLSYLAVTWGNDNGHYLEIYDTATGVRLAGTSMDGIFTRKPWFTPGGREVWVDISPQGWRIVQGGEPDVITLEPLGETEHPPRGFMDKESPCGYKITHDGWVANPTEERILWLPHYWRSDRPSRIWSRRFLTFQQTGRPDIIILEFLK
jgi:hypothetical protein